MTHQTANQTAGPVSSPDPRAGMLSPWHQDQFERHLSYARSLGLSPDHAQRFAHQQLASARPRSAIAQ